MRHEWMNLTPQQAVMTESAEFPGRAIAALAADGNVLAKSGGVFTTPELAREYGFTDIDGTQQSRFWDNHWARPAARVNEPGGRASRARRRAWVFGSRSQRSRFRQPGII